MPRRLPPRGPAAASSTAAPPAPAIRTERAYGARNYDPLPVVLSARRRRVARATSTAAATST